MRLFLHKLLHWEYWPYKLVYIPVYFQWAYYALKARSLFFFNAANPTIKNGGFFMESKKEIYDLIPQQYYPKTIVINTAMSFGLMSQKLKDSGITFPMIAKPDIGQRGSAVKKITNQDELLGYSGRANFDFILQEFIPYPCEAGIFYVRFPHEKQGRITGIVAKEFLSVTGDGNATIEELLRTDPRHEMQLSSIRKESGIDLLQVLSANERLNIVPYGNHARGAKFIDASHMVSPALTKVVNTICLNIPGFYFGRIDMMYNSWEELENGENFALVEVNGASSEPTHIYDPKHSLFFAWKELMRHIRYMFEISVANKKNGARYLSHKEGMREYRNSVAHDNILAAFHERT